MTISFLLAYFRYCYHEDIKVNGDVALSTMYAADKYILPILEEESRKSLIKGLASDNIWEVYTSSIMTPNESLRIACQEYFEGTVKRVEAAFKSPDFLNIPQGVLQDLLRMNDAKYSCEAPDLIMLSQIDIFRACNAWAEAECLRQELEPSGENKREVLGACLFLISFGTMLPEDLVSVVFPTAILNEDEKLALLECAHGGDSAEMQFINKSHRFRIRINPNVHATPMREYSPITECQIDFSAITLKPEKSLMIYGLGCNDNDRSESQTQHMVCIMWKSGESTMSKTVLAQSRNIGRPSNMSNEAKHLYFDEQHLEAGFEYELRVQKWGTDCRNDERIVGHPDIIPHTQLPSSAGLRVMDNRRNDSISHLLIRLI